MARTVALVVNPSKFDDLPAVRASLDALASSLGWDQPTWFETGKDDGGAQAAKDAVASGADVVCAFGGDGTVRRVADVLRGTGTPMGLLPAGTGNLLARNLRIPLDHHQRAMRIALTGRDHHIDVGDIEINGDTYSFMVGAGVGLDAEIMKSTDEGLKKKIGSVAYIVAGVKAALQRGFLLTLHVDDAEEFRQRSNMLLVCNCSTLQAGVEIAVGAAPDDGQLDAVVLRPRGLFGWLAVLANVVSKTRRKRGFITQHPGETMRASFSHPVAAEVDGDVIGHADKATFSIDPGALIVRMPA